MLRPHDLAAIRLRKQPSPECNVQVAQPAWSRMSRSHDLQIHFSTIVRLHQQDEASSVREPNVICQLSADQSGT